MRRLVLSLFALLSAFQESGAVLPRDRGLDTLTLFTFSQQGASEAPDTQVTHVLPQLNLRSWNAWKGEGAVASDFNAKQIAAMHAKGILFQGGLTATVVFREDAPSDSAFLDWITRDANGDTVAYDQIVPGARRASLGSVGFRRHLVELAKVQIDAGVDGLFFDEVNSGFEGSITWSWNGNEGFDDHHLRAFNRYLIGLHPDWTREDFRKNFRMDSANALDPALSPDDLVGNFNYRSYLTSKGWNGNPLIRTNPLASVWGRSVQNRMVLQGKSFVEVATTAWWGEIVDSVRRYARSKGRNVHITSNGIIPFVDFNCVGLYDFNKDTAGKQVDYVPTTGTTLDGAHRLGSAFRNLREASMRESDSAATVLFLDWPTAFMSSYYGFSKRQKLDYWRIFGAEAFANGVFWAFHLKTSMPDDPTAADMGILDSLGHLMGFYRRNASLYHGVEWFRTAVTAPSEVAATSAWQPKGRHLLVHLVNHDYGDTLIPRIGLDVSLALPAAPLRAFAVTPDSSDTLVIASTWKDGILALHLERLDSYAVVVLELPEGTEPAAVGARSGKAKKPSGFLERSGNQVRWSVGGRNPAGQGR
jgi:hypothetical protein